jgi:hypothetical protein
LQVSRPEPSNTATKAGLTERAVSFECFPQCFCKKSNFKMEQITKEKLIANQILLQTTPIITKNYIVTSHFYN